MQRTNLPINRQRRLVPIRRTAAAIALFGACWLAASSQVLADSLETLHPGADQFIATMVDEHGFDAAEVEALLRDAKVREDILKAMRRPAEGLPWHRYRPIFMTDKRVSGGVDFYTRHADTFAAAEKKFGVPVEVIAAIIGVETQYGDITGKHRVLDALVTLGFHYPPRATFFRGELEQFLILSEEEQLPPSEILGSYAGAMGLGQFIPSSYRHYSVDGDGDQQRDLWRSIPDAIFSVANYLAVHGWVEGEPVALMLSGDGKPPADTKLPLSPTWPSNEILSWGFEPTAEADPSRLATLIELEQLDAMEYWLGYKNFYVISRYNHSKLYSMAVYQLSQALKAAGVDLQQ
ncbi:MAG: lytic murein transglycosylase B [Lysobacteraceae bacterium]|nr:MAG: lytic murein transglycosylase B [Xanthomonadaceae bacterium]